MVVPASSAPNTSMSRARSWLTLSSPVSMTRSARSRSGPSSIRSSAIESSTAAGAWGCRRRVPSNRLMQDVVGRVEEEDPHPVAGRASASTAGSTSSRSPPPRPTTKATRSISEPVPSTSSLTLAISADGMLSITNQPRSSRAAPAVDRPAPDIPVTTRYSLIDPPRPLFVPACPARAGCAAGRRRPHPPRLVATIGRPGLSFEVWRSPARPPNSFEQAAPPLGPEPVDPVERTHGHPLASQRAVVGDRRSGGPRRAPAGAR